MNLKGFGTGCACGAIIGSASTLFFVKRNYPAVFQELMKQVGEAHPKIVSCFSGKKITQIGKDYPLKVRVCTYTAIGLPILCSVPFIIGAIQEYNSAPNSHLSRADCLKRTWKKSTDMKNNDFPVLILGGGFFYGALSGLAAFYLNGWKFSPK